jgi:hypothetical protein
MKTYRQILLEWPISYTIKELKNTFKDVAHNAQNIKHVGSSTFITVPLDNGVLKLQRSPKSGKDGKTYYITIIPPEGIKSRPIHFDDTQENIDTIIKIVKTLKDASSDSKKIEQEWTKAYSQYDKLLDK